MLVKEGGSFLSLFFFFFFKGEIERMDGWMDGRKEEELLRSFFPSSSSFFLPPSFFRLFRILFKVRSADDKCARPRDCVYFEKGLFKWTAERDGI